MKAQAAVREGWTLDLHKVSRSGESEHEIEIETNVATAYGNGEATLEWHVSFSAGHGDETGSHEHRLQSPTRQPYYALLSLTRPY